MPPSKCGHGQDLASATVAHQITFALASNTNANLSLAKSEIGLTNGVHFKIHAHRNVAVWGFFLRSASLGRNCH